MEDSSKQWWDWSQNTNGPGRWRNPNKAYSDCRTQAANQHEAVGAGAWMRSQLGSHRAGQGSAWDSLGAKA